MVQRYFTVGNNGETEFEINRSRFICRAKRVHSEKEAQEYIQSLQKQHWDATHNCSAYVVTELEQKASDDGEPAGTAGKPILEVLHQKKLLYTVVVVTRYFGGIKLGAGGLIRAYTQGAVEAVKAAGIVEHRLEQELLLHFDYSYMGKIEHELRNTDLGLETPQFAEHVSWGVWVPVGSEKSWIEKTMNWTAGQVKVELGRTEYQEYPVE